MACVINHLSINVPIGMCNSLPIALIIRVPVEGITTNAKTKKAIQTKITRNYMIA